MAAHTHEVFRTGFFIQCHEFFRIPFFSLPERNNIFITLDGGMPITIQVILVIITFPHDKALWHTSHHDVALPAVPSVPIFQTWHPGTSPDNDTASGMILSEDKDLREWEDPGQRVYTTEEEIRK